MWCDCQLHRQEHELFLHCPEGATPKDGPSAAWAETADASNLVKTLATATRKITSSPAVGRARDSIIYQYILRECMFCPNENPHIQSISGQDCKQRVRRRYILIWCFQALAILSKRSVILPWHDDMDIFSPSQTGSRENLQGKLQGWLVVEPLVSKVNTLISKTMMMFFTSQCVPIVPILRIFPTLAQSTPITSIYGYPSIYLAIYVRIYLHIYRCIYLPTYLPMNPSIHPSMHLSILLLHDT